ncbi:hypothetical protein SK128_025680 [Halocaridina rubra]|uniref:Chitin-binding type-2 domain-containing protein n=1 Tax=Halocaridina rubra TaxID=373956 RepID=A0AAN8X6V4_HALRR
MSQFWSDSLEGIFRYHIKTKWNSVPVEHEPVEITLQGFTAGVEMNVTAPFFNDPAPDGKPGEPFYKLWDYEVVEMFFLNDKDEYLEVEVGPFGQHLLLLLKGARNALQHSLPLDYIILEKKDPVDNLPGQWKGSAMLPPGYFPPNVTRMNAYAIHGTDSAREYQSLYPAPNNDPSYPQADFHRLELFRPMDFQFLMPNNSYYSELWQEAIDSGSSAYTFTFRTEEKEETELVTLLGPSFQRDVFPTTIEPTEDVTTLSPEADITTFDPFEDTTTTIEPFEAVTLIGSLEDISWVHEETASLRKPKPHQVFSNEPREQRLEEEPDLLSFQSVSPSEIPRPHLVSDNIRDSNYFLRPFLFLSNFPDEISPFISVQPKFPVVAPQATNQRQPIFPLQQPDDQTQAQFQVPLPPASQYPLQEERFQSIIPGSETSIPGSEPSIPAEEIRSPEPVTNEFNPSISVGVAENVSTEVEHALITLAEDTPALPPPHPVCFEIGLVPDPDCCFVFHECVLEEGEWQMYSWRCRRGQIFDPKHVACKRGRCSREQMRRTRGRCPRVRTY